MKTLAVAGLAVALSALAAMPAEARVGPPGSYRATCRNIHMDGGSLVATCRRMNGRWVPSALPAVRRCVGDIGNDNGRLVCNRR
jgi:hypothetical protein